jgi:hypothetical protein
MSSFALVQGALALLPYPKLSSILAKAKPFAFTNANVVNESPKADEGGPPFAQMPFGFL